MIAYRSIIQAGRFRGRRPGTTRLTRVKIFRPLIGRARARSERKERRLPDAPFLRKLSRASDALRCAPSRRARIKRRAIKYP